MNNPTLPTLPSRKGIVLAGGRGTRLYPLTEVICKQLLPVYDKPLIYYPLSTLMLGGISEILIISTPEDLPHFKTLFGDGSRLGLKLEYAVQPEPNGIAQAFLIGEKFIGESSVTLILGDNLFYGYLNFFYRALANPSGATIFGYAVRNPQRFGVVEFDGDKNVISIEEKPKHPKSRYAVPGLYVYDNQVVDICKTLRPSARGELEITDLNRAYLAKGELKIEIIGRGVAWLDTGTPSSLLEASSYIATLEQQQGFKVACLEEIAFTHGYIDSSQLQGLIDSIPNPDYADYLRTVLEGG